MNSSKKSASDLYEREKKYLEFVVNRLNTTNFRAKEKLMRIDDLAEIVFTAKKDYASKKNQ